MPVLLAVVTTDPLDTQAHLDLVSDERAGAVAAFVGCIRNHDPEARGEVSAIDYSHHPDAPAIIGAIAERVAGELDPEGSARVAVSHRVGRLEVGDVALVAAVATPHRELAFALCSALVEAVKEELPIWKRQFETDGRAVWSRLGLDSDAEGAG